MEVISQIHVVAPKERTPATHWIGSWVGHRAGLDAMARSKNPTPYQESNPNRPVRSLVTIMTDLPRIPNVDCKDWNFVYRFIVLQRTLPSTNSL